MNKLTKYMTENNLDALYITSDENVQFISGYTSGGATCIVLPDKTYLLTDFRFAEMAEKQAEGRYETVCVTTQEFFPTVLRLTVGIERVGIEKARMTVAAFDKLSEQLHVVYKDVSKGLLTLRCLKTDDEIAIMREGAVLTEYSLSKLMPFMKPGVSELDLDAELTYIFGKAGVVPSFKTIIASGANSSMPHAVPTNRKIQAGDLLTVDMGIVFNGLCTDMTRTFAISGVDEFNKNLYNTVKRAQEAAEAGIFSGISGKEADKLSRDIIEATYPGCFEHGLGHGVGIEIHEEPMLNRLSDTILTAGMVFTVEPGAYIAGKGGVRIEDMGLLTEKGYESFYTFTNDLITL